MQHPTLLLKKSNVTFLLKPHSPLPLSSNPNRRVPDFWIQVYVTYVKRLDLGGVAYISKDGTFLISTPYNLGGREVIC